MKKEMAGVLFKTAQEQMVAHMFAQFIFLSPTFADCIVVCTSLIVIESSLVQLMMSPGDDEYIRNIFSPIVWGIGGYLTAYIIFNREIKRQMTDRRSTLKWQ